MKTETQIAKENIEKLKRIEAITLEDNLLDTISKNIHISECQEHKKSCERWLKFLKDNFGVMGFEKSCEMCQIHKRQLQEGVIKQKIQDLKTAIKLYKQEGI